MEGCSAPLVVKFADTQKEKEQKKIQQMHASILSLAPVTSTNGTIPSLTANGGTAVGLASAPALGQSATTLTANAPLMTNPPQPVNPFIGADAMSTSSLQLLQQMQAVGFQQQLLQGLITLLFLFLIVQCFHLLLVVQVEYRLSDCSSIYNAAVALRKIFFFVIKSMILKANRTKLECILMGKRDVIRSGTVVGLLERRYLMLL